MPGYNRVDALVAVRLQRRQRADLVGSHKPAVACHIRRQNGRQSAFDPRQHSGSGLRHCLPTLRGIHRKSFTSDAIRSTLLSSVGYLSQRPIGCGGWARMTASFTSTPQPGPVGKTNMPFSIFGVGDTNSSFQGTSSMSISMTRKLGIAAHMCALISEPIWPLKLCGATFTS